MLKNSKGQRRKEKTFPNGTDPFNIFANNRDNVKDIEERVLRSIFFNCKRDFTVV